MHHFYPQLPRTNAPCRNADREIPNSPPPPLSQGLDDLPLPGGLDLPLVLYPPTFPFIYSLG